MRSTELIKMMRNTMTKIESIEEEKINQNQRRNQKQQKKLAINYKYQ